MKGNIFTVGYRIYLIGYNSVKMLMLGYFRLGYRWSPSIVFFEDIESENMF